MKIGIDGNMWFCSNGKCLGDPRSRFIFERTLREAVAGYQKCDPGHAAYHVDPSMVPHLDKTPEQYK
jgi:hypothetical protein